MKKQNVHFQMRESQKRLNRPEQPQNQPLDTVERPSHVFSGLSGMFIPKLREIAKNRAYGILLAFGVGLVVGLVVLGWYVWPVQWTDATFATLGEREKAVLVDAAAELNAYDLGSPTAQRLVDGWNSVDVACRTAFAVANPDRKTRILYLVYLSGSDCENNERLAGFNK